MADNLGKTGNLILFEGLLYKLTDTNIDTI